MLYWIPLNILYWWICGPQCTVLMDLNVLNLSTSIYCSQQRFTLQLLDFYSWRVYQFSASSSRVRRSLDSCSLHVYKSVRSLWNSSDFDLLPEEVGHFWSCEWSSKNSGFMLPGFMMAFRWNMALVDVVALGEFHSINCICWPQYAVLMDLNILYLLTSICCTDISQYAVFVDLNMLYWWISTYCIDEPRICFRWNGGSRWLGDFHSI
jgi:hypothetical protein